jgi:uncharacterized protein
MGPTCRIGASKEDAPLIMTEALVSRPLPVPDELTQFFWDGTREGRLVIQQCSDCGMYVHLPKLLCPFCLSSSLTHSEVSGSGTLYSFTQAEHVYHPGIPTPYILALVELDEQANLRMVSNITDSELEELSIGQRLQVWFREITPEIFLPQFRLVR